MRGCGLVEHLEAGCHVGFEWKLVQQARAESVNGLHLQSARRFQRVGEQPPRDSAPCCVGRLAGGEPDLLVERVVIEGGPFRQCAEHAGRHVGGGGLGKGDAQDLRRVFAAQQQIDDPLHQHMCLARASIGRDEYRALGISGRDLPGLGGIRNLPGDAHGSTSLSPPEAAHSLTRARWS